MKCPTCNTSLTIPPRKGTEIERCTECGALWLTQSGMNNVLGQLVTEKADAAKRLQAPSISPAMPDENAMGDDYSTYFNYKHHGTHNQRNARWA